MRGAILPRPQYAFMAWCSAKKKKTQVQFTNHCSDDTNLVGGNINTIRKDTEALIGASREVGLEVNTEKTKYMVVYRHQNA
jgi:hypothetical protein